MKECMCCADRTWSSIATGCFIRDTRWGSASVEGGTGEDRAEQRVAPQSDLGLGTQERAALLFYFIIIIFLYSPGDMLVDFRARGRQGER